MHRRREWMDVDDDEHTCPYCTRTWPSPKAVEQCCVESD